MCDTENFLSVPVTLQFNWGAFVQYAFNKSGYVNVDPNALGYIVDTPDYFQKLGELLQNSNTKYVTPLLLSCIYV